MSDMQIRGRHVKLTSSVSPYIISTRIWMSAAMLSRLFFSLSLSISIFLFTYIYRIVAPGSQR